ncbi:MAG: RNA polymerase sigma factor [Planctomycetota bacterium]
MSVAHGEGAPPLRERAGEWIERFASRIAEVARRHCPAGFDAEELAQEVRVRMWRTLLSEREVRDVPAYLRGVALHAAVDLVRRSRAPRTVPWSDLADPETGSRGPEPAAADDPAGEVVAEEALRSGLSSLLETRRRVVTLHLAGLDRATIARSLGFTDDKVRNLLYRGLEDLRALLRERTAS